MKFVASLVQSVAAVTVMIVLLLIITAVASACILMTFLGVEMMHIMQTPLPY